MPKIVDISMLGARRVRRMTQTEIQKDGLSTLVLIPTDVDEVQPILTEDEAKILADEDWYETTENFKPYGNFMCRTSGRRFFCAINPSKKSKTGQAGKECLTEDGKNKKP